MNNRYEEKETCDACRASASPSLMAYDENTGSYFCDYSCYEDWASTKLEVIMKEYWFMNIE